MKKIVKQLANPASVEYKLCTKCKQKQKKENFYKQTRAKDGYNTWCKSCIGIGMRELARARKKEAIQLLGGCCSSCGGTFHQAAYDFHHTNPKEKEGGIAKLLQSNTVKSKKVLQELSKCILLCSNCHRIIHSFEENSDRACVSGVCGV